MGCSYNIDFVLSFFSSSFFLLCRELIRKELEGDMRRNIYDNNIDCSGNCSIEKIK